MKWLLLLSVAVASVTIFLFPYFQHGYREGIPFQYYYGSFLLKKVAPLVYRYGNIYSFNQNFLLKTSDFSRTSHPVYDHLLQMELIQNFKFEHKDFRVKIYQPKHHLLESSKKAIIYIHGGGWTISGYQMYDIAMRQLAVASKLPVVFVDYRKAPLFKFPTATYDCINVTNYIMQERAPHLESVIFMGDSAGAMLSLNMGYLWKNPTELPESNAMTMLQSRQKIEKLVLIYPPGHFYSENTTRYSSYEKYRTNGYYINEDSLQMFIEAYYGHMSVEECASNPLISPVTATRFLPHFKTLPPSLVLTAEYDILKDGAAELSQKLQDLNVQVTYKELKNQVHASMLDFDNGEWNPVFLNEILAYLKQ